MSEELQIPGVEEAKPDFMYSFTRLQSEVGKLCDKLEGQRFYPDIILGISGGGLIGGIILGAWIASPRFLKRPDRFHPLDREKKELSDELKSFIAEKGGEKGKILLVDDQSLTGETIKCQIEIIGRQFKETEIKVAVIIVRSESWEKADKIWKNKGFYCYPNVSKEIEAHWPWEA